MLQMYLNNQFTRLLESSLLEVFQHIKFWGTKIPIIKMRNSVKSREILSTIFKGQIKILNLMSIQSLTQLNN